MVNFEYKIVKNRKLKISKIQNNSFVRTTEKKIQEKFGNIQKWFEGGAAFWSFCSHRFHVNANENLSDLDFDISRSHKVKCYGPI